MRTTEPISNTNIYIPRYGGNAGRAPAWSRMLRIPLNVLRCTIRTSSQFSKAVKQKISKDYTYPIAVTGYNADMCLLNQTR